MKKFICTAAAVGALGMAGAAAAQDLGAVLGELLGAQAQRQDNSYVDRYGRRVYIDRDGRRYLDERYANDPWRDANRGIVYGLPNGGSGYPRVGDHDGDGVPDRADHCPNDKSCF